MLHLSFEQPHKISRIQGKKRQGIHLKGLGFRPVTVASVLLLLHLPEVQPHISPLVCPEEKGDDVIWPETKVLPGQSTKVSSRPLCISEDYKLTTRTCVSVGSRAHWEPFLPPICDRLQPNYEDIDKCPPPFRNLSEVSVCAHLAASGTWDKATSTCFLSGTSKSILDLDQKRFSVTLAYLRYQLWSNDIRRADQGIAALPLIKSVWLEGRRNKALTPIVRKLPGDFRRMGVLWEELSNATVPWAPGEPSLAPEKQCLTMEIPRVGNPSLRMESCFSRRPAACVFIPPSMQYPLLTRLACPEGYMTSLYQGEQHRCFKIIRDLGGAPRGSSLSPADRCSASGDTLMRLSSSHVNELFVEMAKKEGLGPNDRCLIGLYRKGNRYIWSGDGVEEEEEAAVFLNWHPETNFEEGDVGVVRGDGRWGLIPCRQTLSIPCVVCERAAPHPPRARMTLRLHPPSGRLLLSVYSGEGLWRYGGFVPVACFSDGNFGHAKRLELGPPIRDGRWSLYNLRGLTPAQHPGLDTRELHKTVFVLPTEPGELARYWCEARRVVSLRPIVTDRVWNAERERGKFIFSLALEAVGVCSGDLGVRDCEPTFGSKHYEVAVDLRRRMGLNLGSIRPVRILSVIGGNLCLLMHVTIRTPIREGYATSESILEHTTYLRLMALVSRTVRESEGRYEFLWLRSTHGCVQSFSRIRTSAGVKELHWDSCPLGYSAVPREICLQAPNGTVPVIRTCRGDYMFGGIWDQPSGVCTQEASPKLTSELHALMIGARSGGNPRTTVRKASELSFNPSALSSADIHFLAMTMRAVAASAESLRADTDLGVVTSIVDHVMRARHENVALSQRLLNSTNVLLDAIDEIFGKMILSNGDAGEKSNATVETDGFLRIEGVYAAITSQVAVQVSDVGSGNNVTGVALVRRSAASHYALGHKSESDDSDDDHSGFNRYSLLPLTSEQPLESLFDLQPEVAVLLPIEMLPGGEYLVFGNGTIPSSTRVVTTLFYSDLPFRPAEGGSIVSLDSDEDNEDEHTQDDDEEDDDEDDEIYGEQVNSRVINVWTTGLGPDLPAPVPILFRPLRPVSEGLGRQCAHWDFSASSWGGGWASDGCFFAGTISTGMDVCICSHLTHFAELLLPLESRKPGEVASVSSVVLDVISIVGCILSLSGIVGIIATAVIFPRWRYRLGSKVLLQLTAAIGMEMICFLAVNISAFPEEAVEWCLFLGCALHYSVISTFCWMFVAAGLQYIRFVRVLGKQRPPHFLLKASLFSWGFPLIPVATILAADPYPYGVDLFSMDFSEEFKENSSFCYPSGLSLNLGVVLPVILVMAANICMYVIIIRSIIVTSSFSRNAVPQCNGSSMPNSSPNGLSVVSSGVSTKTSSHGNDKEKRNMDIRHFRLAVLLFFLLGLSWLFGVFAKIWRLEVFSYLFCATATLQGFVLFLFYVVGNPSTRRLWSLKFRKVSTPCAKAIPSFCYRKKDKSSSDEDPSVMTSGIDLSATQTSSSSSMTN